MDSFHAGLFLCMASALCFGVNVSVISGTAGLVFPAIMIFLSCLGVFWGYSAIRAAYEDKDK